VVCCGNLGGNDRSLPFDWPNEKIFPTVVEPEGRFAILPCQVTHRSDVIKLRKNKCSVSFKIKVAPASALAVKINIPGGGVLFRQVKTFGLRRTTGQFGSSPRMDLLLTLGRRRNSRIPCMGFILVQLRIRASPKLIWRRFKLHSGNPKVGQRFENKVK